jgi:hypothetical protein
MIVTEAVPLVNHTTWSNTYAAANDFLTYARNYRNDIRYYIYETWHCINSGRTDTIIPEIDPRKCWYDNNDQLLWTPRLADDYSKWTKIVDSVRILQNYQNVHLIPAGQAFYQLSLEISNGQVPGYTSFRQFFSDDIHLNARGNYCGAGVMSACIFRSSPVGLSRTILNEWGQLLVEFPEPVATKLQEIAWNTVCQNAYSGVNCSIPLSIEYVSSENFMNGSLAYRIVQSERKELNVYYKEARNRKFTLYNYLGNVLMEGVFTESENHIFLGDLSPGVYKMAIQMDNTIASEKICLAW